MAEDIEIGGSNSEVLECSLSYTREGYVPVVYVVGDRTRIETTLFTDVTDFPANFVLKAGWVGEAERTEKETDPTKTDVYSRFSIDPDDFFYSDVDYAGSQDGDYQASRGVAGPKMYRGFANSTFNYDTASEALSGNGMILDTDWKFTGKVGLSTRLQGGSIPYLRIQSGDRAVEYDYKDKEKAVTCIVEGEAHLWESVSEDNTDDAWFVPMTVSSADRFKRYKVYQSYRGGPTGSATDTPNERVDYDELKNYAEQLLESMTISPISGSITMLGTKQRTVGTMIGNIVNDDKVTPVNLAVVDQSTSYSPPRKAGESGQDTVTIELGRK